MTRLISILTLFITTSLTTYNQTLEPLDLAKRIFGRNHFADIDNYITGEYKGQPNGEDLAKDLTTKFLLLAQTENKAVVTMTLLDSTGKGLDTYLHFVKDTIWKMTAFRALAQTGIIEQAIVELEKMTPRQIDEIIAKSKKNKDDGMFSSKEDYEFELKNAKLTIDLDTNIIRHFLNNKTEFEKIKDSALKQLAIKKPDEESEAHLVENLKSEYRRLLISSVSFGGYEFGNCINFLVGGILDNSVGYIYVKDKKDLPPMDPDKIIMIREIGDGWYIYKTT